MKNRSLVIIIITLVIVVGATGLWYWQSHQQSAGHQPPPQQTPITPSSIYKNATADNITVSHVTSSGATVHVEGQARGPWYFEAVFPVEVRDARGTLLAKGQGHAQGAWTTNDFVPFTADITLPKPYTGITNVVLRKDNPSGDPAHDASLTYTLILP